MKYSETIIFACFLAVFAGISAEEDGAEVVIGARRELPKVNLSALRPKLDSPKLEEVSAAADELGESGDPAAAAHLWNLYNGGNAQRRLVAIRALGKLRQKSDVENLFRVALGDLFQSVRFAAAEELARLEGHAKAVERLGKAASEEKKIIALFRMRALHAVAHLGGRQAGDILKKWLDPKYGDIALAAAEGLGMINEPTFAEHLIKSLNTTDVELKPAYADALEQLTGKTFRYDLVKWTQWQKEFRESPPPPKPIQSPSEPGYLEAQVLPTPPPLPAPTVDLVLIFDTTGSMCHIWPQVSAMVDATVAEILKQSNSVRIATIKYRASRIEDMSKYLIQPRPLTRKHQEMRDDFLDASFGGGSGGLHLGIRHALGAMAWRAQSKKIVIIIGDTTPRDDGLVTCVKLIQDAWQADQIIVSSVFVKNTHGDEHRATYRYLAQAGGGRFYEYSKAEKHLVDMLAEKIDVKNTELPAETARKLLAPRE